MWGLRYVDDLMLRDRDTNGDGTLDERLYGMQDANWNVTSIVTMAGAVLERYAYMAYGTSTALTPLFGNRAQSSCEWEIRYTGYRIDLSSGLFQVRRRIYHPLVAWLQRDPLGLSAGMTLYQYVKGSPLGAMDPSGLDIWIPPEFPELYQELPNTNPPSRDAECCDYAKKATVTNYPLTVGTVVCCYGRQVPCVFESRIYETKPSIQFDIISFFAMEHEKFHTGQSCDWYECGLFFCGGMHLPTHKKYQHDVRECAAYQASIDCLNKAIYKCKGDRQCESAVQSEISHEETQRDKHCNAAALEELPYR